MNRPPVGTPHVALNARVPRASPAREPRPILSLWCSASAIWRAEPTACTFSLQAGSHAATVDRLHFLENTGRRV